MRFSCASLGAAAKIASRRTPARAASLARPFPIPILPSPPIFRDIPKTVREFTPEGATFATEARRYCALERRCRISAVGAEGLFSLRLKGFHGGGGKKRSDARRRRWRPR